MLHGGGSDENRHFDGNGKLLLHLAEEHGYLLVSPLGYRPTAAFGTPLLCQRYSGSRRLKGSYLMRDWMIGHTL